MVGTCWDASAHVEWLACKFDSVRWTRVFEGGTSSLSSCSWSFLKSSQLGMDQNLLFAYICHIFAIYLGKIHPFAGHFNRRFAFRVPQRWPRWWASRGRPTICAVLCGSTEPRRMIFGDGRWSNQWVDCSYRRWPKKPSLIPWCNEIWDEHKTWAERFGYLTEGWRANCIQLLDIDDIGLFISLSHTCQESQHGSLANWPYFSDFFRYPGPISWQLWHVCCYMLIVWLTLIAVKSLELELPETPKTSKD